MSEAISTPNIADVPADKASYEAWEKSQAPEAEATAEPELVPTMVDGRMMLGEVELIQLDGFWCDPDTGEVISLAIPTPDFHVTDNDSAEWVLAKIESADSEVARLKALLDNQTKRLMTQIKHQINRGEFMRARFGPELDEFAKANLPKGKKSWLGVHGAIKYRATPEKLDLPKENTEKAVGFLKKTEGCADAIKVTESVLKDSIPKPVIEKLKADPELRAIAGFELIPAGESMTIDTGFKV